MFGIFRSRYRKKNVSAQEKLHKIPLFHPPTRSYPISRTLVLIKVNNPEIHRKQDVTHSDNNLHRGVKENLAHHKKFVICKSMCNYFRSMHVISFALGKFSERKLSQKKSSKVALTIWFPSLITWDLIFSCRRFSNYGFLSCGAV
jgi:hypothetical protein